MTLVDCTRVLRDGMPVYPGDPPVTFEPHTTIAEHGHRSMALSLSTHSGTHLDAPAHTEPDGATIDELPLADLAMTATRMECTDLDPRSTIEPAGLPEDLAGLDALVVHTGWDAHWGSDRYVAHPYLARETAARLASAGVGVVLDCLSPDPTPDPGDAGAFEGLPAHHELLGAGLPVVENCRGIDRLPEPGTRFELRVTPLQVEGADGAPARVVGLVDGA